jgi:hypothetical protein
MKPGSIPGLKAGRDELMGGSHTADRGDRSRLREHAGNALKIHVNYAAQTANAFAPLKAGRKSRAVAAPSPSSVLLRRLRYED